MGKVAGTSAYLNEQLNNPQPSRVCSTVLHASDDNLSAAKLKDIKGQAV